jgi:hypothetical protein
LILDCLNVIAKSSMIFILHFPFVQYLVHVGPYRIETVNLANINYSRYN